MLPKTYLEINQALETCIENKIATNPNKRNQYYMILMSNQPGGIP